MRREGNPCVGPLVVQRAKAGDVLVVNIHDIVVDKQGVSCIFAGEGPLGDSFKYPECRSPAQKRIPWMRVEAPQSIIQICAFRPLEEAVKQAFLYLLDWLVEDYGFSPLDAYRHLELNPEVRINVYQMGMLGRLNYTVGISLPKKHLSRSW